MDESANERFQLLMAADDEDPEVQYQLGLCYLNGIGTPQDGQRAQDYFQRAAEQGHEAAQKLLGEESTPVTSGTNPAPDAANLPELCRAAEDGDAEAQYQAACWFAQSDMPGSSTEADWYLNMAAEQGHGQACLLLGKRALQNDASEQAIELLQNAADCGLGEAMMLLGECYASGNGVDHDTQKAEEFLTQGVTAIGGTAFLDLAMRYATGDGVPVMLGKAMSLVQSAKDSGISDAQQQYDYRYAEYQKQQEELAAQREQERLAAEEAERLRQYAWLYQQAAEEAARPNQEEYFYLDAAKRLDELNGYLDCEF